MKKQNYTEERMLTETMDKVKVIATYELDRYEPRILGSCDYACESAVEDIKESCKIWTSPRRDYSMLTNVELDQDEILTGTTLAEDLDNYQNYLDTTFGEGEYEAFVLGAYIHSGTAFSVNKCGNHVCRFDSSQLGFIGLKRNSDDYYSAKNPDHVADVLTAAWNGEFSEYQVIDNLTNDVIDSIVTADYHEAQTWCSEAEDKYHVSFDNVDPIY